MRTANPHLRFVFGLIVLLIVAAKSPAGEKLPPASEWIPGNVVVEAEVSRPGDILDLALNPDLVKSITELPAYQAAVAEPKYQRFFTMIRYLEIQLNTDWANGVRKLVGGGITVAMGDKGEVVLCVDAEDAVMLERLHQIMLGAGGNEAAGDKTETARNADPSDNSGAAGEYRGVKIWSKRGGAAHVLVGNRLIVANRLSALKAVLDVRSGVGESIATVSGYQAAKKAAGSAAAMAYVNMAAVKENPRFQEGLKISNPLGALLFLGLTDSLRDSQWLSLSLTAEKSALHVRATVDGKTLAHNGLASFAWPPSEAAGALPNLQVPRRIAAGSLYRDVHAFYAAKDALFPERTSGLIFFENMMGIFFTGRDLTEEVLSEFDPDIRFVVAEQNYDSEIGVPQVQFPGAAFVFHLRHPDKAGPMTEEAWQKAIGLMNFTRGQKAEPGLVLDREIYAGVRFTVARFSPPEEKKGDVPTRFNIQPAIARIGDYLVLSSTEALTRDVLDALKAEMTASRQPVAHTSSIIELDGAELSSILSANRKVMANQRMIEQGISQAQADANIGLLTLIPRYVDRAKLCVSEEDHRPVVTLDLAVNPSGGAAPEHKASAIHVIDQPK